MRSADDAGAANDAREVAPTRPEVLEIPALALVVIVGRTQAEAEAFAARHFAVDEIVPVQVGPQGHDASPALNTITQRMRAGLLTAAPTTVPGATRESRTLANLAHDEDVSPVAMLLGEVVTPARFPLGPHGYERVYPLAQKAAADGAGVAIIRKPLACDVRGERGPFDIIGDVHGCHDELEELLELLGYTQDPEAGRRHPAGRRAMFVGDLVDRGPGVVEVVSLVMRMVAAGAALCVPGNHDIKLMRALEDHPVTIAHGLEESLRQISALPAEESQRFVVEYCAFVRAMPPYAVLEGGALVVAHAGMPEEYQGRVSHRIRAYAFYGDPTGEYDQYGRPIRYDWAADYRGQAAVVYGHTPHKEATWINNTVNLDTGCVHGGRLTAARWPERDLVSVAAHGVYAPRKGGLR